MIITVMKKSKALLEAELKAANLKIKRLENRVDSLEGRIERDRAVSDRMRKSSANVAIEGYANYFKYKYNDIKSTDIYNRAERIFAYSRTSLFIARIFRYASVIIAIIETSAVFLLCATIVLIAVPVTVAAALILALFDLIGAKKFNEAIIPKLKDKKIVFLISDKGYRSEKRGKNTYFDRMTRELAADPERFIIVVTKSIRNGRFLTAKFAADNIAVIRETYFFRLRRAIEAAGIGGENTTIVH